MRITYGRWPVVLLAAVVSHSSVRMASQLSKGYPGFPVQTARFSIRKRQNNLSPVFCNYDDGLADADSFVSARFLIK